MSTDLTFVPDVFPYETVEKSIGYAFTDRKILLRAFTLKSFSNENHGYPHYDGLEFLGDSVLSLIVSDHVYTENGTAKEFTEAKKGIVSNVPLAFVIEKLGYYKYLIMGKGERENFRLDSNRKTLENLFEAIVGAIYLDGGYQEAQKFVSDKLLSDKDATNLFEDYYTKLKEFFEKNKIGDREEKVKKISDNPISHRTEIYSNGKLLGCAECKGAEINSKQLAAKQALEKLKEVKIK